MSIVDDAQNLAERAAANQIWPVTVTLKTPVQLGQNTISSLEFRRGRMGDLKGMRVDGIPPLNDIMLIASRLCGQPLKVIESLEDGDCAEVVTIVLGFFAKCLTAGEKP
jgi:hypothetical protein